ncbi:hypothetical protein HK405_007465 [Cladochytrium tenue]|nr:hypothetical protein HK405_007465 [Cladochytrium tenue]
MQSAATTKLVQLGRNGPAVSALGFGAMGLSHLLGGGTSKENGFAVLNRAIDLGLTFIDTSDFYGKGENEKLLAEVLKTRRSEVFLCTKFGAVDMVNGTLFVRGDPAYVKQCCNDSLARLGTDHIDLYYQHRLDPNTPIEVTVAAMAELVKEGKVRYLGLSEGYPNPDMIRRAHAVHPIHAVQVEYSMWDRDIETNGVLKVCEELGIAVVAYSPLGKGFLTGSVRSTDVIPNNDIRRVLPRFQEAALAYNLTIVEELQRLADKKGCTSGQLALAWLMRDGRAKVPVIPIPGTRNLTRLEENTGALAVTITDEEEKLIADLLNRVPTMGDRYPPGMNRKSN